MYDKTLLGLEIDHIKEMIPQGSTICDCGCGEGEGTIEYSHIGKVDAFDKSLARVSMARMRGNKNVFLHDILDDGLMDKHYDVVISQRLLVNMPSWEVQKKAIRNLVKLMKPKAKLILSEGSSTGANKLNELRREFSLEPIPVPSHNLFIEDFDLINYMEYLGLRNTAQKSLGTYYALTRAVQPALREDFHWSSSFNKVCARLSLGLEEYSRVKVWAFE